MENVRTNEIKTGDGIDSIIWNGKQIILIGTAHVSRKSADIVTKTIHEHQPDTVCVELCNTRLASIKDSDRWRNMDIVKIIKEKKTLLLFINLLLASFQKKMADRFGIKPGQEMINAIEAGEHQNALIVTSDREIQITLSRIWRYMGFCEKLKLIFSLIFSFGASDDIGEENIEKMKQEDILQSFLSNVKKTHPIIEKILIDERDKFLTEKIRASPGQKIVAVVGAAHKPGIIKHLNSNTDIHLDELNKVPPAGKTGKILKWLIPAAILVFFIAGFSMEGRETGVDMIWIAANGIFAGIGAHRRPCPSIHDFIGNPCRTIDLFESNDCRRMGFWTG